MRLLLAIIVASGFSHAGTLSTSVVGDLYNQMLTSVVLSCQQSGASSAACSTSNAQGTLALEATADFGNLGADIVGSDVFGADSIFGRSSFTDELTIEVPGVLSGYVEYRLRLTGHAVGVSGDASATIQQDNITIAALSPYPTSIYDGSPVDTTAETFLAPFTSGVPFLLDGSLFVGTNPPEFFAFQAHDMLQFAITGISVFDQSQQPITSGVTITSESSTYGGLVTLVANTPEPSSILLMVTAACGLFLNRARRTATRN